MFFISFFTVGCPYHWVDSTPEIYVNWAVNRPSSSIYNDCVELWLSGSYNGQWLDYGCTTSSNGFCQFYPKNVPETPKPVLPNKAGCKTGWWPFAGHCYKLIGYDSSIWDKSQFKNYMTVW